jgi:hypothetical protein
MVLPRACVKVIKKISYKILAPKITKPNVIREKLQNLLLYKKCNQENVDKIDTFSQFHQHFKSSFCTNIILTKNSKAKM